MKSVPYNEDRMAKSQDAFCLFSLLRPKACMCSCARLSGDGEAFSLRNGIGP